MLFFDVSACDVTEDGHDEGFDAGFVRASSDSEVTVLAPVTAPAVRNDLEV